MWTFDGAYMVSLKRGSYHSNFWKRLNNKGNQQSETTPGFWTNDWRPICFSLGVDDFGVKYVGKQHTEHLITVLKEHYKILSDWKDKRYLCLNLNWDYDNRKVHLSMLGHVVEALTRFRHKKPRKPQDYPYQHIKPKYGAKAQYAEATDEYPPIIKYCFVQ